MTQRPPYRLPRNVIPQHYALVLEPDLGQATFDGEATVAVTVNEPTAEVVLNAADLDVREARFIGGDGEPVGTAITYRSEEEQVVLQAEQLLSVGAWQLHMRFSGRLNDQLRGLPQQVPLARRRGPVDGGYPVRIDRRPAGFPVLG